MERPYVLAIGECLTTQEGVEVSIRRQEENQRPIPSSTADHEARHVVVAGQIHSATIIPGDGYLGATWPVTMTAEAAMASHGLSGTGHDVMVARGLGAHPESAASVASGILSQKADEVHEVATILQEKGTIGQADVDRARQRVQRRRQGILPVVVETKQLDGTRQRFKAESSGHKVTLLPEWVGRRRDRPTV